MGHREWVQQELASLDGGAHSMSSSVAERQSSQDGASTSAADWCARAHASPLS